MKLIKRILFLGTFFVIYVICRELIQLYVLIRNFHPYAGYLFISAAGMFIIFFIAVPLMKIVVMPQTYKPARDPDKLPDLVRIRVKRFRRNPYLLQAGFQTADDKSLKDSYDKALSILKPETERIRKKYVTQIFYTTSIAQNGFLDALMILSVSTNLVKDLFTLYHGRVSNRELLYIGKLVYFSMAIGGSEGVEYAADEIISKIFSNSLKGIPFASKVLGSIADGFVNAALLTRVSIITENYCTMLFTESDRAMFPSYRSVVSATKIITLDLIERILKEVKGLAKDKTGQVLMATVNPVGYVIGKVLDKYADESDKLSPERKELMREISLVMHNPFGIVFSKISSIFRRSGV